MYLERKIDKWLLDWKNKKNKRPALIVGVRQCGKTESIKEFASKNYKNVVEMNFWFNPEFCSDFDGKLDVDNIISNISLRFPDIKIEPHNTLIFFDEIQDCPRARLAFKSFAKDGRFDVIGSGSYLGINGYISGDLTPAPTGYEEVYNMHTLDFEEFLWANNFSKRNIDRLEDLFKAKKPVDKTTHEVLKNKNINNERIEVHDIFRLSKI